MEEKVKLVRKNANGNPHKSRIKEGFNHRGNPSNKRYALIPARAISDPSLAPNDLLVLAALGIFVSRQGVSHPTLQTLEAYTGLSDQTIMTCIKRLMIHRLVRKLQPKWYPEQSSKWLTMRYQILFKETDPIPTGDELISSIPFSSDHIYQQEETTQPIEKTTQSVFELDELSIGIKRDWKRTITIYGQSIELTDKEANEFKHLSLDLPSLFRTYVSRFGSVPITLGIIRDRGLF